jgi:hypothetical protein
MESLEVKLKMSQKFWSDLLASLKERGEGVRESGAFILSDTIEAQQYLLYDDLSPGCLDTGGIHFVGSGYVRLWDFCLKNNLRVIADIHTHPYKWTDQSSIDKNNPMISQKGHLALIAPYFASGRIKGLSGIGIFEYLGDFKWKKWNAESGIIKIY